jgi:uncharacterized membrane protein YhaH (DUF805 family)
MDWMLMAWKKYADFSGRARRKEYWMFVLGYFIMAIIANIVDSVLGMSGMVGGVYGPLTALLLLAVIVPGIAAGIRRLHDQDKSGWFMLLGLIPIANIVLLVFFCLEGTKGPNQYGPDPKGSDAATFS